MNDKKMSDEITATLKFSTGMHCDAALIGIKSNSEQMVSDDVYDCGVYDWIAYNLEIEIPKCSILTIKVSVSPSFWGDDIDEINYEIIGDVVIEEINHDRLTEENKQLRDLVNSYKLASDDVTKYKHALSYNESYAGEPNGEMKHNLAELDMVSCKAIKLLNK